LGQRGDPSRLPTARGKVHDGTDSVRLQSCIAEDRAGALDGFDGRRLDVFERVLDIELVPLVAADLVERQHVHALDVAEASSEAGGLGACC
jgi:hypothetical protein